VLARKEEHAACAVRLRVGSRAPDQYNDQLVDDGRHVDPFLAEADCDRVHGTHVVVGQFRDAAHVLSEHRHEEGRNALVPRRPLQNRPPVAASKPARNEVGIDSGGVECGQFC
jgi:hypothetical protein